MSRERMVSCVKSGGLLCIAALCIEIEILESRNLFQERQ